MVLLLPRKILLFRNFKFFCLKTEFWWSIECKYLKIQLDNVLLDLFAWTTILHVGTHKSNEIRHSVFQLPNILNFRKSIKRPFWKRVTNNGMNPVMKRDLRLFEAGMIKDVNRRKFYWFNHRDLSIEDVLSIFSTGLKPHCTELAFSRWVCQLTLKINKHN